MSALVCLNKVIHLKEDYLLDRCRKNRLTDQFIKAYIISRKGMVTAQSQSSKERSQMDSGARKGATKMDHIYWTIGSGLRHNQYELMRERENY